MNGFNILGRNIPLYGICFYLGITAAICAALIIAQKRKFPKIELVYSGIYTMIGAIIGAKLLFIAVSFRQIIELNIPFVNVIKGGFVFYGGLIGGAFGLFIYTKQFKLKIWEYLDIYAAVLPLGHAFGRVGCFFAGCCYGAPANWGYVYTESAGTTPTGVPLIPIQLIESGCLLILFFVQLAFAVLKPERENLNLKVYLISYPVLRFVLEFFRGDSERGRLLFSTSQWISLIIIIITVFFMIRKKHQNAKKIISVILL